MADIGDIIEIVNDLVVPPSTARSCTQSDTHTDTHTQPPTQPADAGVDADTSIADSPSTPAISQYAAAASAAPSHARAASRVDHLPCKVHLDSHARVGDYVVPALNGLTGKLEVTLRGRLLEGTHTHLPDGCVGVVFQEDAGYQPPRSTGPARVSQGVSAGAAKAGRAAPKTAAYKYGYGRRQARTWESEDEEDAEEDDCPPAASLSSEDDDEEISAGGGRLDAANAASMPRRYWRAQTGFTDVTYWHHDKPATDADMMPSALEWVAVARAIHGFA